MERLRPDSTPQLIELDACDHHAGLQLDDCPPN
jgi:hypothetical protein